jgi:mono/diheme cytochrome c family protein/plastocyanin
MPGGPLAGVFARSNEWLARLFLAQLFLGLLLVIWVASREARFVEVRAVMPEQGGFLPDSLKAEVGVPLRLRLTSGDVRHGFAVGQTDFPEVDVKPGQMTEVSLMFDEPGTYTYYCTRWCGPNHWRMRGTIEVTGESMGEGVVRDPPLYVALGLDIDAPHPAAVAPGKSPNARRATALATAVPPAYFDSELYLTQSPAAAWQSLRIEPGLTRYTGSQLWDIVALIWQSNAEGTALQAGARLYAQNCAACHGSAGAGDGVFGQEISQASDFTDAQTMLGASTALLDGKIRRGGMGTGMPYWGTIFSDEEIEALIAYLWRFQFPEMETGE